MDGELAAADFLVSSVKLQLKSEAVSKTVLNNLIIKRQHKNPHGGDLICTGFSENGSGDKTEGSRDYDDSYGLIAKLCKVNSKVTSIGLNRKHCTRLILNEVFRSVKRFGFGEVNENKEKSILVVSSKYEKEIKNHVTDLRIQLASEIVQSILKCLGYSVNNASLMSEEAEVESRDRVPCDIDVKSFIQDLDEDRKQELDPNLHFISEKSKLWKTVNHLSQQVENTNTLSKIIYVVPSKADFTTQQLTIIWQFLKLLPNESQIFTVGEVRPCSLDSQEFLKSLTNDIQETSRYRLGGHISEQVMDEQMKSLTDAALKFSLFSSSHYSQVKLENSGSAFQNSKKAAFVLYNYARLKKMIRKFYVLVEKKFYQELIPIEEIETDHLYREEEWTLLFRHISYFPCLIEEINQSILSEKLHISISVHQILHFLYEFAQDISLYYNKVHILTEPLPHLIPVMNARIHLVRACIQVLESGMDLVNIQPLDEM